MGAATNTMLLADDVFIDGVGCGETKNEGSDRNHSNAKDHQNMPTVKEMTKEMSESKLLN